VTSFFAGFVIFSVLGYMSKKSHTPIDKVATEGNSLAYFFAFLFLFHLAITIRYVNAGT